MATCREVLCRNRGGPLPRNVILLIPLSRAGVQSLTFLRPESYVQKLVSESYVQKLARVGGGGVHDSMWQSGDIRMTACWFGKR